MACVFVPDLSARKRPATASGISLRATPMWARCLSSSSASSLMAWVRCQWRIALRNSCATISLDNLAGGRSVSCEKMRSAGCMWSLRRKPLATAPRGAEASRNPISHRRPIGGAGRRRVLEVFPETAGECAEPLGLRARQKGRRDDQILLLTTKGEHDRYMGPLCRRCNCRGMRAAFGREGWPGPSEPVVKRRRCAKSCDYRRGLSAPIADATSDASGLGMCTAFRKRNQPAVVSLRRAGHMPVRPGSVVCYFAPQAEHRFRQMRRRPAALSLFTTRERRNDHVGNNRQRTDIRCGNRRGRACRLDCIDLSGAVPSLRRGTRCGPTAR